MSIISNKISPNTYTGTMLRIHEFNGNLAVRVGKIALAVLAVATIVPVLVTLAMDALRKKETPVIKIVEPKPTPKTVIKAPITVMTDPIKVSEIIDSLPKIQYPKINFTKLALGAIVALSLAQASAPVDRTAEKEDLISNIKGQYWDTLKGAHAILGPNSRHCLTEKIQCYMSAWSQELAGTECKGAFTECMRPTLFDKSSLVMTDCNENKNCLEAYDDVRIIHKAYETLLNH
jgi:hypothetical protein